MRSNFPLLLLLLLALATVIRGDFFHYYKLRKFITAVAFARALGKRPTILPVPIPIPIPISQNEVVRIPASSAKTYLTLKGSPKYSGGFSGKGKKFIGSSPYGYSLPGSFDSLGSNVMFLDGNNMLDGVGGSDFASPSNVVRLISGQSQGFFRKPKRYIITGGGGVRTTRNSENLQWSHPQRQIEIKNPIAGKSKKPIPVGERFKLP